MHVQIGVLVNRFDCIAIVWVVSLGACILAVSGLWITFNAQKSCLFKVGPSYKYRVKNVKPVRKKLSGSTA